MNWVAIAAYGELSNIIVSARVVALVNFDFILP